MQLFYLFWMKVFYFRFFSLPFGVFARWFIVSVVLETDASSDSWLIGNFVIQPLIFQEKATLQQKQSNASVYRETTRQLL